MRAVSVDEVRAQTLEALELSEYELGGDESLASLIRTAAVFRCPCSRRALVDEVLDSLSGVGIDADRARVSSLLESLLSYGDLIEADNSDGDGHRNSSQVFVRPPSFVRRAGGGVLLLGAGELDRLPLPVGLQDKVVRAGHTRRIRPEDAASQTLGDFIEIPADAWGWKPAAVAPQALVADFEARLAAAPDTRDVDECRFLDSSLPVDYWPARWVTAPSRAGSYLVRRPRKYGSELWGYGQASGGRLVRLLDISGDERERACDKAWRLQMAIDAGSGHPQQFAIQEIEGRGDKRCLSLYSPVPQWAQRRWDNIGQPIAVAGALFSYELPLNDAEDERSFCASALWLEQVDKGPARERTED